MPSVHEELKLVWENTNKSRTAHDQRRRSCSCHPSSLSLLYPQIHRLLNLLQIHCPEAVGTRERVFRDSRPREPIDRGCVAATRSRIAWCVKLALAHKPKLSFFTTSFFIPGRRTANAARNPSSSATNYETPRPPYVW